MNSGPLLFLGTFFALATSWLGFVLAPQLQIGGQTQVEAKPSGELYPQMRPGLARQGEQIYRANGCYYCHSQQVRPKGFGSDFERQWGGRGGVVQSVDQDYLYDRPAMLGTQRIGPDLTNIGLRQTNQVLLLQHLYDPQLTMPKSLMPPYRFLFEKRKLKLDERPSEDAVSVGNEVAAGYEVVPTDDARALVAYLLSLHSDAVLFETPPFPSPKKVVTDAKSTNAPGGAATVNATAVQPTNSVAK